MENFSFVGRIESEQGPTRLLRAEESIQESIESILESLEEVADEMREKYPEKREDIDHIQRLLLLKGERDLRYWMKKRQDSGEVFLKEFSVSAEFFRRKFVELLALLQEVPKEGTVLDVACGTGDLAILTAMRGQKSMGVELDSNQVRMGMFYAKKLGVEVDLRVADLLKEELPSADHWVAKHPCAKGMALPDEIISRWADDDSAHTLTCMTCCQGKAQNSFPGYLGIDGSEWKQLCRTSDWTNNPDEQKRFQGHLAMAKIDDLRVKYLRARDVSAKLKTVEETIKGDIIIAKK